MAANDPVDVWRCVCGQLSTAKVRPRYHRVTERVRCEDCNHGTVCSVRRCPAGPCRVNGNPEYCGADPCETCCGVGEYYRTRLCGPFHRWLMTPDATDPGPTVPNRRIGEVIATWEVRGDDPNAGIV